MTALFLVFVYILICTEVTFEINDDLQMAGKEQYETLLQETKLPKYSSCWTDAIKQLHNGCKRLTDDSQMELALAFTNCFLQKSGKDSLACVNDQVKICLEKMDVMAFTTYTKFFTHTRSMCHFLQSQVWYDKTDNLIYQLTDNSEKVAQRLKESGDLQLELLERQEKAIDSQEEMLRKGNDLRNVLEMSKENIREAFSQLKSDTEEQRMIVLEIFDRITNLQSLLVGEFTGFYSIIYYVLATCILYFLTSTPRTNGSRLALFLLLGLNFVVERIIVAWGMELLLVNYLDNSTNALYIKIWWCRKVFALVIFIFFTIAAYRYQDFNQVNNQLLRELQQQCYELNKHLVQRSDTPTTPVETLTIVNGGHLNGITGGLVPTPVQSISRTNGRIPRSTETKLTNSRRKKRVTKQESSDAGYDSTSEVSIDDSQKSGYNLRRPRLRSSTPQLPSPLTSLPSKKTKETSFRSDKLDQSQFD